MAHSRKLSKCLISYRFSSTKIFLMGEFWGGVGGGGGGGGVGRWRGGGLYHSHWRNFSEIVKPAYKETSRDRNFFYSKKVHFNAGTLIMNHREFRTIHTVKVSATDSFPLLPDLV
jgi:hypothetical protein